MPMDTLWSVMLTAGLGLISWFIRSMYEEISRLRTLLNRTREEIAKEYITKAEVHADINRVIDRLEALDAKLDRLFEKR